MAPYESQKTLLKLFQEEKYDYIYIPRIQRDYAQGRDNEEAAVIRENILDDVAEMRPLSWGIVFGVSEDRDWEDGSKKKCFIPVDGQQRLTTLYLLNLYGEKCHHEQFGYLSRFNYETRDASRNFITALVKNWHGEREPQISLKEDIINQGWFLNYWKLDPTVDAMLNMLTDIDARFRNDPQVFQNLERIRFEFLDLNNLKLNETLYLKMNSRGRRLSQFDKIKSEIDKILPEQVDKDFFDSFVLYRDKHIKSLDSFAKRWRYCIDRKWSDLFWDKKSHKFDVSFLAFLTNYLIACAGKDYAYADNLLSVDFNNDEFFLPWKYLGVYMKSEDNAKAYLGNMAAILNKILKNGDMVDTNNLIAIPESFSARAMQFGLVSFQGADYSSREFDEWKRFIHNYATNTVEDKDSFFAFAKRIQDEFSSKSTNILAYLSSKYSPDRYERTQLNEEFFKAHIILQGGELGEQIRAAEKHPLLNGRLRPLISQEDKYDEKSFTKIWSNFTEWFGEDGKALEFIDGDNVSLSRRTDFTTAFTKGIYQMNQLFDDWRVFDFSFGRLKEKLQRHRFESIFRRCLLADNLSEIEETPWKNNEETEGIQTKKTLLIPGVIKGILASSIGEKSRFRWYHNCLCFFPYNGKSANERIGFDRINDDPLWTRNRNTVLSYLKKQNYLITNQTVSDNVDLWWGNDILFTHPDHPSIQLWWDAYYNIGIIKSANEPTWIKRHENEDKNPNFLFNAVEKNANQIKKRSRC